MSGGWTTIESDPGVFTELISEIGTKGVQVEELYSLDSESFAQLGKIYGLVFLFKWQSDGSGARPQVAQAPNVFFANQAILSILLNRRDIEIGEELTRFREFTADFPPDMKGLAISNSDLIRRVHNSFSRPEPFVVEERKATEKDDVYHFISYVPIDGVLYELDGLQAGPIAHGPVTEDNWTQRAAEVIQKRIEQYAKQEIRFNLMALVANRAEQLTNELNELQRRRAVLVARLRQLGAPLPESNEMDTDDANPEEAAAVGDDVDVLQAQLCVLDSQMRDTRGALESETEKYKRWKVENMRRKHNYIPFVVQLLRILAEKDALLPLLDNAKSTAR